MSRNKTPNAMAQFVDDQGRLTVYGMQLLRQIIEDAKALEARVEALEP